MIHWSREIIFSAMHIEYGVINFLFVRKQNVNNNFKMILIFKIYRLCNSSFDDAAKLKELLLLVFVLKCKI